MRGMVNDRLGYCNLLEKVRELVVWFGYSYDFGK